MVTLRGKGIKYGWFKDKTTSKLVKFTPKLIHFAKLHGVLHFLPQPYNIFTQIYICHICDISQLWAPLSPHQAVQSLPDKKAVKPLGEAPMEMSECPISYEPPALNRQCNNVQMLHHFLPHQSGIYNC